MKTTKQRIRTHETLIEILEAIQSFEGYIQHRQESINGFAGTFPRLRNEYLHNIDIYQRCITRLNLRHSTLIKTLSA